MDALLHRNWAGISHSLNDQVRHSSGSWNLSAFAEAVEEIEIPAFAGMTGWR
jgi:hypothetical protein